MLGWRQACSLLPYSTVQTDHARPNKALFNDIVSTCTRSATDYTGQDSAIQGAVLTRVGCTVHMLSRVIVLIATNGTGRDDTIYCKSLKGGHGALYCAVSPHTINGRLMPLTGGDSFSGRPLGQGVLILRNRPRCSPYTRSRGFRERARQAAVVLYRTATSEHDVQSDGNQKRIIRVQVGGPRRSVWMTSPGYKATM